MVRQLQLARDAGALERLPLLLASLGTEVVWSGDFAAGAALVAEADAVCEVTGSRAAPFAAMMLASLRGNQAEAAVLIEATLAEAAAAGQGIAVAYANWVAAILANGLGRYEAALAAARQAAQDTSALYISMWALPELIEAAARSGNAPQAAGALTRLAKFTQAGGTDFGLGIEARSRALLSGGHVAEDLYCEAIGRLGRTRLRPELARSHLLYGEWLRRENRRTDARAQLRTAHEMLAAIGMEAFAERARDELLAVGETVRQPTVEPTSALSAQEAHIARLAADGRTNPEIAAQLFLSARTVEWHLCKVFTKLGISSRRQLQAAMADVVGRLRPVGRTFGPQDRVLRLLQARCLAGGLGVVTGHTVVGDRVVLNVGFRGARTRLRILAEGGMLLRASEVAYGEGITAVVELAGPAAGLTRLADVCTEDLTQTGDCAHIALQWDAIGADGERFTTLLADLMLVPAGDQIAALSLTGAYWPPPGRAGAGPGQVIARCCATAVIGSFLDSVVCELRRPAGTPGTAGRSPVPDPGSQP